MKHIDEYSKKYDDDYYWLVPTDDRLEDALTKIGLPRSLIHKYINFFIPMKIEYMFIGYDTAFNVEYNRWNYMPFSKERNDYYEENGFKYIGAVNIPEYELDANKYNI